MARKSFATLLGERLGRPVLNLGRGGASPATYTHASWPLLGPVLAQAGVVITVVMAGRSSSNSAFGYGASIHSRLLYRGSNITRLQEESLATARRDYRMLFGGIRELSAKLGRVPPKLLLMWMSTRPIHCHGGSLRCKNFPAWITGRFVNQVIDDTPGLELVDASYKHQEREARDSLSVLHCPQCPPGKRVCGPVRGPLLARQSLCGEASGRPNGSNGTFTVAACAPRSSTLCPLDCLAVASDYYPPSSVHEHAARLLDGPVAAALHVA